MPIDKATGTLRSKRSDVVVPNQFAHDFVLQRFLENFERDRLCETEFATNKSSTCGWLLDRYRQVASWLRKQGIGRGDRIAFYSKSYIEYTPCVLATWRVGATCSYLRPEMITDIEYRKAVGIPRLVFVSEDRTLQILEAGFENIIVFNASPEEVPAGCTSFDEILLEEAKDLEDFEIDAEPSEVLAVVSFTGGTTGNPKPIQLTHTNFVSTLAYELNGIPLAFGAKLENVVQLCPFPTVHITGVLYRICSLLYHGHTILVDPPASSQDLCEAMERYRVNVMTTIPVTLIALARYPDLKKYDLSSWQTCVVVSGPLLPYMQQEVSRKLGLRELYLRLGMSECCGTIMVPTLVPGSVGDLCSNTQAKVLDLDDGSPITESGVVGELCIRGPQRTIGYYNLPEKNKAAIDEDGFLHTGDLVSFDEDFNFYYFDRAQEFILHSSGRMVSATELELIIAYQNPTVLEVSVIPSANGPRAIVVPVVWPEDEEALRQEITSNTNQIIDEDWKQLTGGVAFLRAEDVPRSVLGKHLKRLMKHV